MNKLMMNNRKKCSYQNVDIRFYNHFLAFIKKVRIEYPPLEISYNFLYRINS